MYKQRFSIGDLVVVKVGGTNKIGVLVSRSVMKGSRVFNVKLESGTLLVNVRVDNTEDTTYIDSSATLAICAMKKVDTNLTALSDYNLKVIQ